MSIDNAFRAWKRMNTTSDGNVTSITQLPASILESFIPGYSIISKFLLDTLGVDITLLVSLVILAFGLTTSVHFAWKHSFRLFEDYCMSSVRIESDDDIFSHVMDWLSNHKMSSNSRKLMAKTGKENAWDTIDGTQAVVEVFPNKVINFNSYNAKVPLQFQPSFGSHLFIHGGSLFLFKRQEKQMMVSAGWGRPRDDEHISLSCVGRSTQPVKNLIEEARSYYLGKEKSCTVVRRPCPKEHRGRARSIWMKVATRPSRPIHTVVLNNEIKNRLLMDINEYLHPSAPKWYANRGIPYRRGYLLHGPPGSGKSSLAWAIAGVFGLDIYCVSLVDPSLSEEDLGMMFTSLPRRCIVLLEDIDTAGLSKRQEDGVDDEKSSKGKEEDSASNIGTEIKKAFNTVRNSGKDSQGITLSGLLNAIDGVASHEGRVLIMTTNFPEKLDEALIRPGRIDMSVPFTNASRSQIKELFVRMYSPDPAANVVEQKHLQLPTDGSNHHQNGTAEIENKTQFAANVASPRPEIPPMTANQVLPPPQSSKRAEEPSLDINNALDPHPMEPLDDIETIAAQFAARLPEDTFTPAEIQGFLLTRKKAPRQALEEVDAWREDVLKGMEKRALVKEGEAT